MLLRWSIAAGGFSPESDDAPVLMTSGASSLETRRASGYGGFPGEIGAAEDRTQNLLKRSRVDNWERLMVPKSWVAKTRPSASTTVPTPVWVQAELRMA